MPRNGSGNYTLPAGNPVVTGTTISSTTYNNTLSDVATAITNSIAKDGQTPPTANMPMATFRHTNVGNAVSQTDYAAAGQVQNNAFNWAGVAGGTADAITLLPTPAITAYVAGQQFVYKSGASANTGAMTVSISGLAAVAIQKNGAGVGAGDHPANRWFRITYDGAAFQLEQIQPTLLNSNNTWTANNTWTGTSTWTGASTFNQNVIATSINKVSFTTPLTSATLTIADGKTFTSSNTLTLAGTDGSTLNVGSGGTLGSAAYINTPIAVGSGGTGATTAGGARANLGAAGLADANTFTAQNSFPAGSAAAPSVRVGSEQNGMFSPAPNELDLTTGGVSRININAVGDTTLNNAARLRGKNSTGSMGALIYRGSDDITYIGEPAFGNPLIMRPGGAIQAAPGNVVRWTMDTGGRLLSGNISPATGFAGVGDVTLGAGAAIQSRSAFSAWVRHNAAGTITRGLNVGSVTKNGTGDYTANITSGVMADGSYGFMHMVSNSISNSGVIQLSSAAPTATGFRYQTFNTNSLSTQDIAETVVGFLP